MSEKSGDLLNVTAHIWNEKAAQLAAAQAEIAALTKERDALRDALSQMREQYERANQSGWNQIVVVRAIEDADDIANEALAALEANELRKP